MLPVLPDLKRLRTTLNFVVVKDNYSVISYKRITLQAAPPALAVFKASYRLRLASSAKKKRDKRGSVPRGEANVMPAASCTVLHAEICINVKSWVSNFNGIFGNCFLINLWIKCYCLHQRGLRNLKSFSRQFL